MSESSIIQQLSNAISQINIIDTHEHLIQEKERLACTPDLFQTFLAHYLSSDLISAGMSYNELSVLRDSSMPLETRWTLFAPYWDDVRYTGYAQVIEKAVQGLYSVSGLSDQTYETIASRMAERNQSGLYNWVLRDKAGIEHVILDSTETPLDHMDYSIFAPVMRFRDFIMVRSKPELHMLEQRCQQQIHTFHDLIQALESEINRLHPRIAGIKIGLAYQRTLKFDKVTYHEAEEVFTNIFNQETFERVMIGNRHQYISASLSLEECKPLQDFLVHRIIQVASRCGLPIQIHTGLQEGNENIITNSQPTLLTNLFREYRNVRFDIFHGAYPYSGELAALAKNFQNVYIDLCWLHMISPVRARYALSEWLDTVPSNKIFGFGGDYRFIEGVYGHVVLARANIAQVLADKVDEGIMSIPQAIQIASRLLHDNAYNFFLANRELQ
jgi:predicted TIM-barrel fold metal-dependent hydrolase